MKYFKYSKALLMLFLITSLFILIHCGPPSQNETPGSSKSTTGGTVGGSTPAVALPPTQNQLIPVTPATSSLTIGSNIPLDCDTSRITQGHNYGAINCNAISANVSIRELSLSSVSIDRIELIGAPEFIEGFIPEIDLGKIGIVKHVMRGAAYIQIVPKPTITLLSAQGTVELEFLTYQPEEIQ